MRIKIIKDFLAKEIKDLQRLLLKKGDKQSEIFTRGMLVQTIHIFSYITEKEEENEN